MAQSTTITAHESIRGIIAPPRQPSEPLTAEELTAVRKYIVDLKAEEFLATGSNAISLSSIYPFLLESLLNSPGLGDYRTLATDALSVWTQRTSQCCSKSQKFTSILLQQCTAASVHDADVVFDFVCEYWTDSGAALGNALRELFLKTISLIERIWTADEKRTRLGRWVDQILKYPKAMRVVYFTIEILAKQLGGRAILKKKPTLLVESLNLTYSNALANPVSKMITAILVTIRQDDIKQLGKKPDKDAVDEIDVKWLGLWIDDVREALKDDNLRPHIQIYLLPYIFRVSSKAYRMFLANLAAMDNGENFLHLQVCCFKVGQDLRLLEDDSSEISVLSTSFLSSLFCHSSPDLRIGGLSLAVSSPRASKPISSDVLDIIASNFDQLFLESDPEFRNRIYGFMRQMITRIRDSCVYLYREIKKKGSNEGLENMIKANKKFVDTYITYLQQLLRPGSSYQRINTGLRLYMTLVRSGLDEKVDAKWHDKNHLDFPFNVTLYTKNCVRLLIDNLVNNYEDIRETSAALLKMAPVDALLEGETVSARKLVIDGYASKGYIMITGLRGREGDGGARILDLCYYLYERIEKNSTFHLEFLYQILSNLENAIKEAERNLALAVTDFPLHGYFTTLRLIFDKLNYSNIANTDFFAVLLTRLCDLSRAIWEIVEPTLCSDAPEGSMPDEIEEEYLQNLEKDHGPASQVVLSYSWRAIGESSGLLTTLLTRVPEGMLSDNQLRGIGQLLLTELASIRHRGAFSSIYPTFVACCSRCNVSPREELSKLPQLWLDENIELVQTQAQVITRRSGGLPYLVTGVLAAESDPERPLLRRTFESLSAIAQTPVIMTDDKVDLPQVHALNCIKSVFIEAKLSSASAFYIDQALAMAITAFASEVWSIRNCGVMMFAALQTRLFGSRKVTDSRLTVGNMSARLFFGRYKQIKDILQRHLEQHVDQLNSGESANVETVYPVLSLLSRLEGTNDYTGLEPFRPLIMSCLSSRIWKIRESAAWSLMALVSRDSLIDTVVGLINELTPRAQNGNHGRLLAVQALVEKYLRGRESVVDDKIYHELIEQFGVVMYNRCSPNALLFIRICKLLADCVTNGTEKRDQLQLLMAKYLSTGIYRCGRGVGDKLLDTQCIQYFTEQILQRMKLTADVDTMFSDLVSCLSVDNQDACIASLEVICSHVGELKVEICDTLTDIVFDLRRYRRISPYAIRLYVALILRQDLTTYKPSAGVYYEVVNLINVRIEEQDLQSEAAIEALGVLSALRPIDGFFDSIRASVMADEMPFSVRRAGLVSTIAFLKTTYLLTSNRAMLPEETERVEAEILKLYAVLDDDDEELRAMATEFLSLDVLKLKFVTTSVYLKRTGRAMLKNFKAAIFSATVKELIPVQPGAQGFETALTTDTALFVIESPNLYRDEIETSQIWEDIGENALLNPKVQSQLLAAVRESLPALLLVIESQGYDGPLGWVSKPEVFTLGMKVLRLYRLLSQKALIPEQDLGEVYEKIRVLACKNSVHFMWGPWEL
ncbi:putative death-receptor fusion protein-domain-containing protein [Lipomyces arxii]|uniref:putative death-receptor fusion protein-domain-containing protein n=1 Tax=Lipomyces arxii TaxID=56418 RepID=UPI0034CF0445